MRNLRYIIALFISFAAFNLSAQPDIEEQQDLDFEILKNLELFELVYKNIDLNYVDQSNPGELMKVAIDAMLYELDPYTTYIPESRIEDYKLMSTGQYGGIGAIIRQDEEEVIVIEPHEGFPAQKAGLLPGDIFMEIDGKSVAGLTSSQVSEKLKGKPGTPLTVKVLRNNAPVSVEIIREEIKFSPVPYSGMVTDKVGYIKLRSFTKDAGKDVLDAFNNLKAENGMEQLIFDLRGNGGGLVVEAVKIVSLFIKAGTEIVSIKGRDEAANKTYTAFGKNPNLKIPIVVLVDIGSASASEIVAGALQDLDRAVILGQTSFGKGLVQRPLDLKYNAKIKVTIAKYYTPSGRCIQKLDYSNRIAGSKVGEISDSLLTTFKTANGREVADGRGIEPDVTMDKKVYSILTATMVLNNIVFDYATKFQQENTTIASAAKFNVTDEIYNDFKAFVLKQEFEYVTMSSDLMKQLKEAAEKEEEFSDARAEYEALMLKLTPSKSTDLEKYKAEIIPILEEEIVGRYYYQKGKIIHGLVKDEFILEAVKILNDSPRYKKTLNLEN